MVWGVSRQIWGFLFLGVFLFIEGVVYQESEG